MSGCRAPSAGPPARALWLTSFGWLNAGPHETASLGAALRALRPVAGTAASSRAPRGRTHWKRGAGPARTGDGASTDCRVTAAVDMLVLGRQVLLARHCIVDL